MFPATDPLNASTNVYLPALRETASQPPIRIPKLVFKFLSAYLLKSFLVIIAMKPFTKEVIVYGLLRDVLEHDRHRVVIACKHLPSSIRSLREDLSSSLVLNHGCDLESVKARPRKPYVTNAFFF
jgi:hypothetical protein